MKTDKSPDSQEKHERKDVRWGGAPLQISLHPHSVFYTVAVWLLSKEQKIGRSHHPPSEESSLRWSSVCSSLSFSDWLFFPPRPVMKKETVMKMQQLLSQQSLLFCLHAAAEPTRLNLGPVKSADVSRAFPVIENKSSVNPQRILGFLLLPPLLLIQLLLTPILRTLNSNNSKKKSNN